MELFVVIAVIAVLAIMVYPGGRIMDKERALRVQCVNNLQQIGLADRVWETEVGNGTNYPIGVSVTNGGSMEFIIGPNEWRHFQIISNELYTPKVLICPTDSQMPATNFAFLRNSNISYFVGIDAVNETDPQRILSGDRNITNGTPIKNGILELTPNQPAGWTAEMHEKVGNLLLSDGSVSQVSRSGLQTAVANTGIATNRLQMPILGR